MFKPPSGVKNVDDKKTDAKVPDKKRSAEDAGHDDVMWSVIVKMWFVDSIRLVLYWESIEFDFFFIFESRCSLFMSHWTRRW